LKVEFKEGIKNLLNHTNHATINILIGLQKKFSKGRRKTMAKIFKEAGTRPEQKLSARRKKLKWGAALVGTVLAALPLKMSAHCYENTTGYYSNGTLYVRYKGHQVTCLYYNAGELFPSRYVYISCGARTDGQPVMIPWYECAFVVLTNQLVSMNHTPGTNDDEVFLRKKDISFLTPIVATET
jgi:hypothetical protein